MVAAVVPREWTALQGNGRIRKNRCAFQSPIELDVFPFVAQSSCELP